MAYPHERHTGLIGGSIKEIVYGANDGIITTFAVISGVVGASLEVKTILILGFANLLADGFSMAASNYLGSKSEEELAGSEYRRELKEIDEIPEMELREVREVLEKRGYGKDDAEAISGRLKNNREFFADFMVRYELGLNPQGDHHLRAALFTFWSFVIAGSLPIIPFLWVGTSDTFLVSSIATGVSLFVVGALRYFVTGKNWFRSGLEMLSVGGVAAVAAYGVGYAISVII